MLYGVVGWGIRGKVVLFFAFFHIFSKFPVILREKPASSLAANIFQILVAITLPVLI